MPTNFSRLWLVVLLALAAWGNFCAADRAWASQAAVDPFSNPATDYRFGQEINFHIQLQTDQSIASATIFLQSEGSNQTILDQVNVTTLEGSLYQLDYHYPVDQQGLRAFLHITYRFSVRLASGQTLDSADLTFYYEDNRFQWQVLEEGSFRVHYYEGDLVYAQKVLDVAQNGLDKIHSLLDLPTTRHMDLYVYADPTAMQDTLTFSGKDWVAGHADPDLDAFSVTLPAGPEQELLTEQRVPHELMHILLYQKAGAGYANLPTWFSEGLASAAELYPNPDYQILLNAAYEKRSLLPITSLCQAFPRDASSALLAYAQAASFTNFLYRSYGASGLNSLLGHYTNGLDCDLGVQNALGKNLAELESAWRKDIFGENALANAFKQLLPWLLLLVGILAVPVGLVITRLKSLKGKN